MKSSTSRYRLASAGCLVSIVVAAGGFAAPPRPNVVWITSEDNSPYLGCYGDPLAQTPNLDRLAGEGVRYRHAFANAPVCSAARSTLIAGMYASTLGIHNHRSRVAIPPDILPYPVYLRAAGYYCTNNSKQDYNIADVDKPWDESSPKAHYRKRAPGQPFFAVFNLTESHEGRVAPKAGKTEFRVPPERIKLPPYHPDTPVIRRDWANYYDAMTLMDQRVGEILDELDREGLSETTIVFYYGDHGGALPRGKRNMHDSGTRVPMIIRFPPAWAHLAPVRPGEWTGDIVSFVDLPATLFHICGVDVPPHFEGRPFLGPDRPAQRDHVFLFRGRMDERYDTIRAVRDRRYRYIRNFAPHRTWGQHYVYPFTVLPSMRSWREEFAASRCTPAQAVYWQTKPSEEFYDVDADPFEIRNLADDPSHGERMAALRETLRAEILASRDTGFIPEGMFDGLADDTTIFDYARSGAYPLPRILDLAERATSRDAGELPALIAALNDPHPVIRYWAATGCLVLGPKAAGAKPGLLERLTDDWPDVRLVAAEALAGLGEVGRAMPVVAASVKSQLCPGLIHR